MEIKKQTCGICAYGDGKWNDPDRQKIKKEDLPTCEFCKADGWTSDPTEVVEGIKNDPELNNLISRESPYMKRINLE